jgi:hypothetical protein
VLSHSNEHRSLKTKQVINIHNIES